MARPPRVDSDGHKELEKAVDAIEDFQKQCNDFSPFATSKTEKIETEPQTKLSTREAKKADAEYLKPVRSISRTNFQSPGVDSRSYWKEEHRPHHDRDWEYVRAIFENNEVIGESIETWTSKWGCDPAHFWRVPVNRPVMVPRMLAEQLARCKYIRRKTDDGLLDKEMHSSGGNIVYGMVAEAEIKRIDARPIGSGF